MVRMCSDGVKPPEVRLGYRNAIQGLIRILREEGPSTLFKGMGATTLRSVVMNATQLSWRAISSHFAAGADHLCSYDMIKDQLLTRFSFKDNVPTHLLTALLGGTISVTACAPIDVFKSRIQSSPPGVVRLQTWPPISMIRSPCQ